MMGTRPTTIRDANMAKACADVIGERKLLRSFLSLSIALLLLSAPLSRAQAGVIADAAGAPLPFSPPARSHAMQMYSALPMSFEANAGQTDPRVKFLAHAPGYSLFLTDEEAVLSFSELSPARKAPQLQKTARAVRIRFLGGNAAAAVAGKGELQSRTSYFIGNDPKRWHANLPNYSAVKYSGIYPGVDAVFHGDNRRFEFDFDIAPGADPHSIALEVDGARNMRLNRAGDLVLGMDTARELIMNKPHVYQELSGARREILGSYALGPGNRIAFKIGPYDHTQPLIIDPTLVYSTYLGGSYVNSASNQYPNDLGKAIAVDSAGDVYVAGPAGSVDFPVTMGAYDTTFNSGQITAFVSELNPSGTALLYSTFLGSTYPNVSTVEGIALDGSGDAYLTGYTNYDYPTTPGAFMSSEASNYGTYAFVTELNPTGTSLVYSTYLSGKDTTGSPETYGFGIAADSTGNAYVVGTTNSQTFPVTTGAYQASANCTFPYQGTCTTAFVTKINAGGSSLSYSTYLGTGGNRANAVAIDSSGDAFVVGNTESNTFPVTSGAFMTSSSSTESLAFVTELNPSGTALVYSTFLAGSNSNTTYLDDAYAVAVDGSGYAYVTGNASDSDFPTTPGAYEKSLLDYSDAFVTKLNLTGSALVYSTYLPGLTTGYGIGVNSSGEAYVVGDNDGNSNDFPTTPGALQTTPPTTGTNGFLTVFNSTGSGLVYSTYLGPTSLTSGDSELTVAWAVALDAQGSAYVTGSAPSGFLTTSGAYKTALSAGNNAFIMKFSFSSGPSVNLSPSSLTFASESVGTPSAPQTLTVTNNGTANLTIASALIGGTDSADFTASADTCTGATLTPLPSDDSTCTINVTFTPIAAGSRGATLIFTDNASNSPQSVALTGTGAGAAQLTISPTTIPYAIAGESYFENFTATGGSGTGYTWSVVSGTALSAVGLSLTSAGVISGDPNATETVAPFTVKVVDSQGNSATQNYTLTVYAGISATPTTLPAGTMGTPYSQMLTAGGGAGGPYTFSVVSETGLSAVGLTLSSAGLISGTPSAAETAAPFTLQIADSLGDSAQLSYTLTIKSASGQPAVVADNETITVADTETFPDIVDSESITVTDSVSVTTGLIITGPSTLPAGTVGVPYPATTFTASGGSGMGYTWSATEQPAGLTMSPGGVFSGTPTAYGNFTVTVTVKDSAGNSNSANFPLTVAPAAPIASLSPTSLAFAAQPSGTASAPQTVTLSNTGSAALSITGTGINITGPNATDFSQTNPCGTSVAAGSNCVISVKFTPSLSAGSETATLNVNDTASGSPQQVQLSGIALPPPSVSCTIPTVTLSGDKATAQITCTATDFSGMIALECNLPASLSKYISCSFSPSSLNFASSSTASTTLTIEPVTDTNASLGRSSRPWAGSSGGLALGAVLWLPAGIFVFRRKKGSSKRGILLLWILLCGLPLITSCAGKSGPPTPPAGTYQASVTLTGPGLNQTITFTIQEP